MRTMSMASRRRTLLGSAGLLLIAVLALALAYRFQGTLAGGVRSVTRTDPGAAEELATPRRETRIQQVTLTLEKLASVGIRLEPACVTELTEVYTVPGTVEADPDLQVEIRPRVTGIVRDIPVVLGQKVARGDVLAVLDSVDVGAARLDLRARRRALALVRSDLEWESTVAENVEELTGALARGETAADLERLFAGKPLGDQRALLLTAYANLESTRVEEQRQTSLVRDQVIGEPKAALAQRARLGAQATFQAALEQVLYDARRSRLRAEQAVQMAEAAVVDARHHLEILGVAVEEQPPTEDGTLIDLAAETQDLTAYPILAPFDGTIVTRMSIPSQRVEPSDVIMILVNMTEVHAVAQVPESHFAFLPEVDDSIALSAVAYPGRSFSAHVHSIGAEVDPRTRTVPIHTHVSNADESLRLGMFLSIELTRRDPVSALTVPSAAVVEIEQESYVFQPGDGPNTFVPHPVSAGERIGGRRVILAGLSPGREVVAEGAFSLKSEWILQNEPEEE